MMPPAKKKHKLIPARRVSLPISNEGDYSIDTFVMTLRSRRRYPSEYTNGFVTDCPIDDTCLILGVFESKLDAVEQIPESFKWKKNADYHFELDLSKCTLSSPVVVQDNRSAPPDDGLFLHYQYGQRGEYDMIYIEKRPYNSHLGNPSQVFVMILSSCQSEELRRDSWNYDDEKTFKYPYSTTFQILGVYDSIGSVVKRVPSIKMPAVGQWPDEYFPSRNFAQDEYSAALDHRDNPPDSGILVSVANSQSESDAISVEKMFFIKARKR